MGQEVVEDLLIRGHQPTAVVPTAVQGWADQHPRVALAVGDITDAGWLESTVAGAGAALDVLSAGRGPATAARARTATTHLLGAMEAHEIRRYVGIAPHDLYPAAEPATARGRARSVARRALHPAGATDTRERWRMVTASPLTWTIVRTPALTAGPARGVRQVYLHPASSPGLSLTRTDTARFLGAQVLETSLWWTSPVISN